MITYRPYTGRTVRLIPLASVGSLLRLGVGAALGTVLTIALLAPRPAAPLPLLPAATATPATRLTGRAQLVCPDGGRAEAERLLAEGQWERAAAAAQQALPAAAPCPQLAARLRAAEARATVELLFVAPPEVWDHAGQAARVEAYLGARAALGEPPPLTDLQLARRAYDAQLFPLARAAIERAAAVQPLDASLAQLYASTLYNIASWELSDDARRGAALQLLATSACVEERYGLSSMASREQIRQIAGPDPAAWPAPATTPLLGAAPCMIGGVTLD